MKLNSDSNFSGWWQAEKNAPVPGNQAIIDGIADINSPLFIVNAGNQMAVAKDGIISFDNNNSHIKSGYPLEAYIPPLHPQSFGELQFKKNHNLRYAYIVGAMANGITSVQMVKAAGEAGMLGFFGAAGLSLDQVNQAIHELQNHPTPLPFGFNLIHSPNDPELEMNLVRLYLKQGIHLISASAYLDLTLPLVYYRVKGIHSDQHGNPVCPNKIIAKVSRIEVARKFFSPPPEKYITQLLEKNLITEKEAALAKMIPMAQDLTAEADSGGHTDNRPALALLPTMLALRDELSHVFNYQHKLNVGLAGGISTPNSAAAAFAMGAAYILTGSINQACVESGTSDIVRQMLAEAGQADVTMAPAADMFELGVKVQVLKRGTMFSLKAAKLYEFYRNHARYEEIPSKQRSILEKTFFHCSFKDEWEKTRTFFATNDPSQITKAEQDSRHKMALVFRSYLGRASGWAIAGTQSRKIDYQIWCGPAMGAFNEWTKGSFLEKPENRKTAIIALNLLYGAAISTRAAWLRCQGVNLPPGAGNFAPMPKNKIKLILTK